MWKLTQISTQLASHSCVAGELWVAPELLRLGDLRPKNGTPEGDIYSFGIILSEIVTRELPFAKNDFDFKVEGAHGQLMRISEELLLPSSHQRTVGENVHSSIS